MGKNKKAEFEISDSTKEKRKEGKKKRVSNRRRR